MSNLFRNVAEDFENNLVIEKVKNAAYCVPQHAVALAMRSIINDKDGKISRNIYDDFGSNCCQ